MTQDNPTHPLSPEQSPVPPPVHPDGDPTHREPPVPGPAPIEDPDNPDRDPNGPEPIDEPGEPIPGQREPLI
ncbi:hypothetical protein L1889_08195 [Paenalcaligenes niemegkensis]|uniref:hypothetical protein n=1 Tax=Paenalcaligenes niemegkensis TaxID=2895469 RepID=UPI001EE8D002|nr:hypothetical protein [Paenalcaligenes niemegkensis]MCQ9616694.1 hypothetical protein [Paenalcaligenes niemegkensis]